MKLRDKYKRLSVWNKLGVLGALASILGIVIAVATLALRTNEQRVREPQILPGRSAVKPEQESQVPTVTAETTGESSPAIAVGGSIQNSQIVINPTPEEGFKGEAKTITNEILTIMESMPLAPLFNEARDDLMIKDTTAALEKNPYNVRALLMRGQWHYSRVKSFGGAGFRDALSDFQRSAEIEKKLADPHFGIGSVLFNVAVFDLVNRGLYEIVQRGALRTNQESGAMEMRHPLLHLFPDNRNKVVLQAALVEFQIGRKLHQIYDIEKEGAAVFFAPSDIENRIRVVRELLGYEPAMAPSQELLQVFTGYLSKIEPDGFLKLFEFRGTSE